MLALTGHRSKGHFQIRWGSTAAKKRCAIFGTASQTKETRTGFSIVHTDEGLISIHQNHGTRETKVSSKLALIRHRVTLRAPYLLNCLPSSANVSSDIGFKWKYAKTKPFHLHNERSSVYVPRNKFRQSVISNILSSSPHHAICSPCAKTHSWFAQHRLNANSINLFLASIISKREAHKRKANQTKPKRPQHQE